MRTRGQQRRSFYKREARRALRKNPGLMLASVIAISADAGIASLFGGALELFTFTFVRQNEIASEAFLLLGRLAASFLSLPIWLGIIRAAGIAAGGGSVGCADCMFYLASSENYAEFIVSCASLHARLIPTLLFAGGIAAHTEGPLRIVLASAALLFGITAVLSPGVRGAYEGMRMILSFIPQLALVPLTGGVGAVIALPYVALALQNYRLYSVEISEKTRSDKSNRTNKFSIKKPRIKRIPAAKETT